MLDMDGRSTEFWDKHIWTMLIIAIVGAAFLFLMGVR